MKSLLLTVYLFINADLLMLKCIIIVYMKIHTHKQNVCTFIIMYNNMLGDTK